MLQVQTLPCTPPCSAQGSLYSLEQIVSCLHFPSARHPNDTVRLADSRATKMEALHLITVWPTRDATARRAQLKTVKMPQVMKHEAYHTSTYSLTCPVLKRIFNAGALFPASQAVPPFRVHWGGEGWPSQDHSRHLPVGTRTGVRRGRLLPALWGGLTWGCWDYPATTLNSDRRFAIVWRWTRTSLLRNPRLAYEPCLEAGLLRGTGAAVQNQNQVLPFSHWQAAGDRGFEAW